MACIHAHLVKDSNLDLGGSDSTTYSCEQCGNMFTVTEFKEDPPVYGTT